MLSNLSNPKDMLGLFCLLMKTQGYSEKEIDKMNIPKSRKTRASYMESVSGILTSLGVMPLFSKKKAKLVSVGGSSDIENIEGYSQVNPSNSTRMTNIKRTDDFRLSGGNLDV
jgi:hypothetical protein